MKRIIIFLFALIMSLNIFAQNETDLLKKHVDNSFNNSEFIVQNPSFYSPEMYFPKLKSVCNKIIKETTENYEIDENGNKYYGDSDIKIQTVHYYVFNKVGHISDQYGITYSDSGYIYSKFHNTYKFKDGKYIVINTDLKNSKERIEEYTISENNNQLLFTKKEKYTYRIIYEKNKILYQKLWNEVLEDETEYLLTGDQVEMTVSYFNKGEKIKSYTNEYLKGALIKSTKFLNDGTLASIVVYGTDTKKFNQYHNSKLIKDTIEHIKRTYSKDGFLSEQSISPIESGGNGKYDLFTRQALSEPDSFLLKEFR